MGDNLDKNINPRFRRVDKQTQSLHFFQYFAVRDRVNLTGISDCSKPYYNVPIEKLPLENLLPTPSDDHVLLCNFSILASRVIVEELPYFKQTFEDAVVSHINHIHSVKMAKKSETVSLYMYMYTYRVVSCMYMY